MERVRRSHLSPVAIGAVIAALALMLQGAAIARFLADRSEDAMLALFPSAARAVRYGDRHFNAKHPALYDIYRAEALYERAVMMDPTYPTLQHQLGRIAFLKKDYAEALARIDLELKSPNPPASSYYMRGLIEGFQGDYEAAAKDYETYLSLATNWAAVNDYAWVLLKAGRPDDAAAVIEKHLAQHPNNPWLLNSSAIALFSLGRREEALARARAAVAAAEKTSESEWLAAYPGNDPKIAPEGLSAMRAATINNMHRIEANSAPDALQSK